MRHVKIGRWAAGLATVLGAVVLSLALLTAGAGAAPNPGPVLTSNPDGPQTANVPYVAWIGEHVRLVACDPAIEAKGGKESTQFSTFSVEDWSGYQFQPPSPDGFGGNNLHEAYDPGPSAFFASTEPAHEGDGCVATDYKSLNPGLARIKVDVRSQSTGETVFSEQFLVIWLTVNKPVLNEASLTGSGTEVFQGQLSSEGRDNLSSYLGDPSGNGEFLPSPFEDNQNTDKGLVQIRVTGSFPVVKESPMSQILPEPSYTLPTAWPTLASSLSSSTEEDAEPGTNPLLWDIHGTPGSVNGDEEANELVPQQCKTGAAGPYSSTDNCNGGLAFSRVFGDLTSGLTGGVGPYDPQLANQTLLSDGRINADDAPMPAMRVDVSIAGNVAGGLGGVGQLSGASKRQVYSHDFTGEETPHNLYNPYYSSYIPATERPGIAEVSGIDGPHHGSDFPGFLNEEGAPYSFWTSVHEENARASHSTGCLQREYNEDGDYYSSYYNTPGGDRTQTFYTDERGEAYVVYTPGDGFYLENLPTFHKGEPETIGSGKVIKNADGGCDLKLTKGAVIGESSISASAVYPYEPVDYRGQTSEDPITKIVKSDWEKEFFTFPKGEGAAEQTIQIAVAKAQDIDGYPIVGEEVCFVVPNGGTVEHFKPETIEDPTDKLGFGTGSVWVGPSRVTWEQGTSEVCEETNDNGLAAVEVKNSELKQVDLNVEYVEENIIRDHAIGFGEEESLPAKSGGSGAPSNSAPATTTTTTTTTTTAVGSSAVATSTVKVAGKAVVLTRAQKLALALKACRKESRKKRVACEVKARHAYAAKKVHSKRSKS